MAEPYAFWVTSHVRIDEDHKEYMFQAGSKVQFYIVIDKLLQRGHTMTLENVVQYADILCPTAVNLVNNNANGL